MGSPQTKAPSGPYADKLWREALRRAVFERVEGEQNLDRLAKATVRRALDDGYQHSMAAAKEIGDRLDGKPAQAIVGGEEGDNPVRVVAEIRRVIVDPKEAA